MATPVVDIADQTTSVLQWTQLSTVLSVFDADGDAITQWQIWDSFGSNSWWADGGIVDARTGYTTTNLDGIWFQGDTSASVQTFYVRAFDGQDWGAWDSFNLTTTGPANVPPVADVSDQTVGLGQRRALADVITVTDAESDGTYFYNVFDNSGANNWWVDGINVDASGGFVVSADAQIEFSGDSAPGSQTLWVQAYDGKDWSSWDSFTLETVANAAPVLSVDDLAVGFNQWTRLSDVLDIDDFENDAIAIFEIWDSSGTDSWWADGGIVDASSGYTTTDLAGIWFRGDAAPSVQTLWVRGFDGANWSEWDPFQLTSEEPNVPPVATVSDQTLDADTWRRLSDVLTVTDANGDTITNYEIWDSTGSDNWWADGGIVDASAGYTTSDLAGIWFRGDSVNSGQTLWVRAFDGEAWSDWDPFWLTTVRSNTPPVATVEDQTIDVGQTIALDTILTVTDAENDTITNYEIWDSTGGNNWIADGGVVDASSGYTTSNLAGISIQADPSPSAQILWIRAFDGEAWSDWDPFEFTTQAANAPPVAQDDAFSGVEDTRITGNVLADNGAGADSDPDGDPLFVTPATLTTVQGGAVTLLGDGGFTYDPALNFHGTDSFGYTVSDGNGGSDTATVTLTVTPAPAVPIFRDQDWYVRIEHPNAPGSLAGSVTLPFDSGYVWTPIEAFDLSITQTIALQSGGVAPTGLPDFSEVTLDFGAQPLDLSALAGALTGGQLSDEVTLVGISGGKVTSAIEFTGAALTRVLREGVFDNAITLAYETIGTATLSPDDTAIGSGYNRVTTLGDPGLAPTGLIGETSLAPQGFDFSGSDIYFEIDDIAIDEWFRADSYSLSLSNSAAMGGGGLIAGAPNFDGFTIEYSSVYPLGSDFFDGLFHQTRLDEVQLEVWTSGGSITRLAEYVLQDAYIENHRLTSDGGAITFRADKAASRAQLYEDAPNGGAAAVAVTSAGFDFSTGSAISVPSTNDFAQANLSESFPLNGLAWYLTFDGIRGSATQSPPQLPESVSPGWVRLDGFDFSAMQALAISGGSGDLDLSGSPQAGPMTVDFAVSDFQGSALDEHTATGALVSGATVVGVGNGGGGQVVAAVEFGGVKLTESSATFGAERDRSASFIYESVGVAVSDADPFNPDHKAAGFDFSVNAVNAGLAPVNLLDTAVPGWGGNSTINDPNDYKAALRFDIGGTWSGWSELTVVDIGLANPLSPSHTIKIESSALGEFPAKTLRDAADGQVFDAVEIEIFAQDGGSSVYLGEYLLEDAALSEIALSGFGQAPLTSAIQLQTEKLSSSFEIDPGGAPGADTFGYDFVAQTTHAGAGGSADWGGPGSPGDAPQSPALDWFVSFVPGLSGVAPHIRGTIDFSALAGTDDWIALNGFNADIAKAIALTGSGIQTNGPASASPVTLDFMDPSFGATDLDEALTGGHFYDEIEVIGVSTSGGGTNVEVAFSFDNALVSKTTSSADLNGGAQSAEIDYAAIGVAISDGGGGALGYGYDFNAQAVDNGQAPTGRIGDAGSQNTLGSGTWQGGSDYLLYVLRIDGGAILDWTKVDGFSLEYENDPSFGGGALQSGTPEAKGLTVFVDGFSAMTPVLTELLTTQQNLPQVELEIWNDTPTGLHFIGEHVLTGAMLSRETVRTERDTLFTDGDNTDQFVFEAVTYESWFAVEDLGGSSTGSEDHGYDFFNHLSTTPFTGSADYDGIFL